MEGEVSAEPLQISELSASFVNNAKNPLPGVAFVIIQF
jgi:hypothetical protein